MNVPLTLAIWLTASIVAPALQQSTVLGTGSPVIRSIGAGDSHAIDLRLDAGQAALVEIEADGIGAELRVTEPNGDTIAQFADLFGGGRGQMAVAADTAGPFVLTVSARRWPIESGSYTLRLTGLRQITPSDRELLRAMRLRSEMGRAEDVGNYGLAAARAAEALAAAERANLSDNDLALFVRTSLLCTATGPNGRRRDRCMSGLCPSSNGRSVPIIRVWRACFVISAVT